MLSPNAQTTHVLVVEDEIDIRRFIGLNLELEGYSVAMAEHGLEALERIAERRPDVILCDLSMPVMCGQELQMRLLELDLHLPIVFMSAGYAAGTEAQRLGAAGYLSKPFELDQMLSLVAGFAGRPERGCPSPVSSEGGR